MLVHFMCAFLNPFSCVISFFFRGARLFQPKSLRELISMTDKYHNDRTPIWIGLDKWKAEKDLWIVGEPVVSLKSSKIALEQKHCSYLEN